MASSNQMVEENIPADFDGFTKNMILGIMFFLTAPIVVFSSLFSLITLSYNYVDPVNRNEDNINVLSYNDTKKVQVFSSLPSYNFETSFAVDSSDARSALIENYLKYYKSPLLPYSHYIVQISDKYGLDYRLLTAIAQQESNLCRVIPTDSYNCWGWGIHSKGSLKFNSFEEAIETVARGLKEEYINKGYTNPEDIMSKYTPMSQGSWALGVSHFMEEMENGTK